MIFCALSLLVLLIFSNRKQNGAILRYCFLKPSGFQSLQKTIIAYGYQYHLHHHILLGLLCAIGIAIGGFLFQLSLSHIGLLVFGFLMFVPLLVLWSVTHAYQERRFHELTTFLQHFIALFKLNPKLYQTLHDCEYLVSDELQIVIQEVQKNIQNGKPLEMAFEPLRVYCPHFILHNLLTITTAVEEHGSFYYQEGLDFIQDDIDDWIEDVYAFKKQQLQAKNRMLVLCGFAALIAFVSMQMLHQIDFQTQSNVYQLSMSFFFICIGITLIMAHRILQENWIDQEENVCWKSSQ